MTDLIRGTDPWTGEAVGPGVPATDRADLDATAARAAAAFPLWSATPASERARALRAVADALDAETETLAALADAETALGRPRLTGEVGRTTGQLRMFADLIESGRHLGATVSAADPASARPDLRRMVFGRGVVAVFAASNFAFAFSVAGGDTASALAAGCPVIVKAHEAHPQTSAAVADVVTVALASAGAPDGVFQVVYGPAVGAPLVQHPVVSAVGFTGSTAGGRALFDLACARPDPIPFHGELGSVNPVVVLPAAAAARPGELATGYAQSLTLGTGQFCTNPGLLFVPDEPALLAAIADAVSGTSTNPMLTDRIRNGFESFDGWSGLDPLATSGPGEGAFGVTTDVRRVDLDDFAADADRLTEERFGPGGLVVTYTDPDALLARLRELPGSLTATVHADPADYDLLGVVGGVLRTRAGRLIANGWPTGVAVCAAQQHGGPWPASTNARDTSVGGYAIDRWLVPVAFQDWPDELLPTELTRANPLGVPRFEE